MISQKIALILQGGSKFTSNTGCYQYSVFTSLGSFSHVVFDIFSGSQIYIITRSHGFLQDTRDINSLFTISFEHVSVRWEALVNRWYARPHSIQIIPFVWIITTEP